MKCQSRPRSKVPPIKGHSRFMILSDGLTDHGHESMSRSSLCIFKKRFLKAFPLPCLNHAAIQHLVPRADNACSIVAIIKPATSHRQLPCLQKTRRERKDWCWDMIEAGGGAAPRCYLSLASGWLATPPLLFLIYRPPSPIVEKTRYGQILLSERQDATARSGATVDSWFCG